MENKPNLLREPGSNGLYIAGPESACRQSKLYSVVCIRRYDTQPYQRWVCLADNLTYDEAYKSIDQNKSMTPSSGGVAAMLIIGIAAMISLSAYYAMQ